MGASAWLTIVSHDPTDPAGALQAAQAQVLRAGTYHDAFGVTDDPEGAKARFREGVSLPADFPEPDRSEILAHMEQEVAWRVAAVDRFVAAEHDAQRIAALRDAAYDDGTHSVIDVTPAALTAAATEAVRSAYGDPVPKTSAVRARPDALLSQVPARGSAVWFAVRDGHDGAADAVAFVGVSGD